MHRGAAVTATMRPYHAPPVVCRRRSISMILINWESPKHPPES